MSRLETLNRSFDKLVAFPEISFSGGKPWSVFQIWWGAGLISGTLLILGLAWYLNLSVLLMFGLDLVAILTFVALAFFTKIVTGQEELKNYHHQLTILLVAAGLLWLLNQPILPYLDILMLGVGLVVALGRIGCLMVGCCYGKPHPWGVCYQQQHVAAGLPPYLLKVRLFPVQALESLWVFGLVGLGAVLSLSGPPPGTVLVWYFIGYSLGRFYFEFLRGDPDRPYWASLSEAQWTALGLLALTLGAEVVGLLPWQSWPVGVALALVLTLIITQKRQLQADGKYQLLHPYHIKEVGELILSLDTAPVVHPPGPALSPVDLRPTSRGIQLSAGRIEAGDKSVFHYTLSKTKGPMSQESAEIIARLIIQLKAISDSSQLIKGQQSGIFHLVIHKT
jgi:hypothetical protein